MWIQLRRKVLARVSPSVTDSLVSLRSLPIVLSIIQVRYISTHTHRHKLANLIIGDHTQQYRLPSTTVITPAGQLGVSRRLSEACNKTMNM